MKFKITLNGKTYEVEVEEGQALSLIHIYNRTTIGAPDQNRLAVAREVHCISPSRCAAHNERSPS